ncbi:MAG: hypothetical protein U0529_21345 [Thermoanaerobaculia bacterium]
MAAGGHDRNLTVDVAGISEKLTGRLTEEFKDLILIASYVLAADSALTRGDVRVPDMNLRFRRQIHLVIGVKCLSFWSKPEIRDLLERTIGALSDDDFTFDFVEGQIDVFEQLSFSQHDGSPMLEWGHIDEVALFSGGLDSLSGAAQLIGTEKRNVILVSHRAASKTWKLQRTLVGRLRGLSHERGPDHVGIQVMKHDARLRPEHSQRSRSFLYASLAGAVAHLVGRPRVLLFENGVVALNLPVSPQIIGAAATRTAHPRVLRGFSRILEAVAGRPLAVENPFVLKTRAEVLKLLVDCGAQDLIRDSVSCAHVNTRLSSRPHCGKCSQCIDRRFGVLAAGLEAFDPEDGYEIGLERGEWSEEARLLPLEYVASADRYAEAGSVEAFLARCGEANRAIPSLMESLHFDAEGAAEAIFALCRRHGSEVDRVLAQIFGALSKEMRTGKLPATSLPMLLASEGLRRADGSLPDGPRPNSVRDRGGDYQFRQEGEAWILRYRGARPVFMKPQKGLTYIRLLLQRPGKILNAFELMDISEGKPQSVGTISTTVGPGEAGLAAHDGKTILTDRPGSLPLGVDEETLKSMRVELLKLREDRAEAVEFCDETSIARCDDQTEKIEKYIRSVSGLGGKPRSEGPEQKRARTAISAAILRAIKAIRKQSEPLASHLSEQLAPGFFLRYQDTGIRWET